MGIEKIGSIASPLPLNCEEAHALRQPGVTGSDVFEPWQGAKRVSLMQRPLVAPRSFHDILRGHLRSSEHLLELLKDGIRQGFDIDQQDETGMTCLNRFLSMRSGDVKSQAIIDLLLAQPNIQVGLPDREGITPIYRAFQNASALTIDKLVRKGAKIGVAIDHVLARGTVSRQAVAVMLEFIYPKCPPSFGDGFEGLKEKMNMGGRVERLVKFAAPARTEPNYLEYAALVTQALSEQNLGDADKEHCSVEVSNYGYPIVVNSARGTPRLIDTHTGIVYAPLLADPTHRYLYSPGGMLVAEHDADAKMLNIKTHKNTRPIWSMPLAFGESLAAFSKDNSKLATMQDGQVKIFETRKGEHLQTIRIPPKLSDSILCVEFSPEATFIAIGGPNYCLLVDVATGQIKKEIRNEAEIAFVRFSHDEKRLVMPAKHGNAKVCTTDASHARMDLEGHKSWHLTDAKFSPCGQRIATTSRDGFLRLFDVSTGKVIVRFHCGDSLDSVAFYPCGTHVVTSSRGHSVLRFRLPQFS